MRAHGSSAPEAGRQVAMMDCKLLAARHSTFEATERSEASRSSFTILRA